MRLGNMAYRTLSVLMGGDMGHFQRMFATLNVGVVALVVCANAWGDIRAVVSDTDEGRVVRIVDGHDVVFNPLVDRGNLTLFFPYHEVLASTLVFPAAESEAMRLRVKEELERGQIRGGEKFARLVALGPEAVPALCEHLETYKFPAVILEVMAKFQDPRAVPDILEFLKSRKGEWSELRPSRLCFDAVDALKEIADPRAEALLLEIAAHESCHKTLRYKAYAALARLGSPKVKEQAWNEIARICRTRDGVSTNAHPNPDVILYGDFFLGLCEVLTDEIDEELASVVRGGAMNYDRWPVISLLARREETRNRPKVIEALLHVAEHEYEHDTQGNELILQRLAFEALLETEAVSFERLLSITETWDKAIEVQTEAFGKDSFIVEYAKELREGKEKLLARMRQRETPSETAERVTLAGASDKELMVHDEYRQVGPNLIERVVTVTAAADMRYYLDFGWRVGDGGTFHSFSGEEGETRAYSPSCAGPEFGGGSKQTFPFLGWKRDGTLYGVIGDTPGFWENRCFMQFDVENRALHIANGDGSPKREVVFPTAYDATTVYRTYFDGWQHIEIGETQTWKTWIFASPVESQYDVQLAAHLALANANGFGSSGLEAILRNTSYILIRRNLLRTESDYILISGVGYGWKQWVTDGFYINLGLDDPKVSAAAHAAIFYDRISYEDNAQYYLIWSYLVKQAGGDIDMRTVRRAYDFMRAHERDGLFCPPRLKPDHPGFKTYMDMLPYEDGDAPSSNQGFHCGALIAARELGFDVSDEDIERAKEGYRRMFNETGGYLATSLWQQEHIGQDALYGEVLTYAVFGEKLLPDEIVRTHLETTERVKSPYGMRVISKANGDLLDTHSGSYTYGGSWFLLDGANYLAGAIHGMDPQRLDDLTLWRLEKELVYIPAFHESINTVNGKPHGHHLYSWNSGYWWLREKVRERLDLEMPDPLPPRLDKALGVAKRDGRLVLEPGTATLRP